MSAHSAFNDLAAFTALPRITHLALSTDGMRLVAAVQSPDQARSRYTSALWEIPLAGGESQRPTELVEDGSSPIFRPDGSLVFVSARPTPQSLERPETTGPSLWTLAPDGQQRQLASRAGGLTGPMVASASGTVVALGSRLVGSGADDDASRRAIRSARGVSAVLHTGMPVRHPFYELDIEYPQLLQLEVSEDRTALRDLAPDAGRALVVVDGLAGAASSISADGRTVVTQWSRRERGGAFPSGLAVIDTATGTRTQLLAADRVSYMSPRISPDAARVAVLARHEGRFDTPLRSTLCIASLAGAPSVDLELGDLHPGEWVWAPDSRTVYVSGDLHGRGGVVAYDVETGLARAQLASDAVYNQLRPSPDGRWVYALRQAVDCEPSPVRLDTRSSDQVALRLATPAPTPALPGSVEQVSCSLPDGSGTVQGYLCLPHSASADAPAPLMQWIHGGPLASYNTWSWRMNPWVFVAHGWAVLLTDPGLSTGYGPDWISRAWPHRAARVWADVEGLLDAVTDRVDIDGDRTACLGASFGGFMTNWIAGHTDRFRAIVTHAGLYALDQLHDTTDAAYLKNSWFDTRKEHPEWYAQNSPEESVDNIRTPMLITHGNGDYNVPISEAQRLWWDLVSSWPGEPDTLPHRFLRFTTEHHWILNPANAEIWYHTVLSFCTQHVLGDPPGPRQSRVFSRSVGM